MNRSRPQRAPFTGGHRRGLFECPRRWSGPTHGVRSRTVARTRCPGSTTGARPRCHRGKLSVLKASSPGWMLVHGMSKHRPHVAKRSCAGLGAHPGQLLVVLPALPLRWVAVCRWSPRCDPGPAPAARGGRRVHQSDTMGPLRVKDIAAPEVKFLDRCEINRSEGVLQGRVRRSRMRAWGSKMIRHRRSPQPSTMPARPRCCKYTDSTGATPPATRNPSLWVQGGVLSQG